MPNNSQPSISREAVNELEITKLRWPFKVFESTFPPLLATVLAHPSRIALIAAGADPRSLLGILKRTWPNRYTGIGINTTRCLSAVTAQSVTNDYINRNYTHSPGRNMLGVLVPAAIGTAFASTFEVALARKYIIGDLLNQGSFIKYNGDYYQEGKLLNISLWKFNRYILGFFLTREIAFCGAAFSIEKNYRAPSFWLGMGMLTYISAIATKLADCEANVDLARYEDPHLGSKPDFKQEGFVSTIKKIARGEYTHPTCAPRYHSPTDVIEKTLNVSRWAAPPNVLLTRFVFLVTFITALEFGKKVAPVLEDKITDSVRLLHSAGLNFRFFSPLPEKAKQEFDLAPSNSPKSL